MPLKRRAGSGGGGGGGTATPATAIYGRPGQTFADLYTPARPPTFATPSQPSAAELQAWYRSLMPMLQGLGNIAGYTLDGNQAPRGAPLRLGNKLYGEDGVIEHAAATPPGSDYALSERDETVSNLWEGCYFRCATERPVKLTVCSLIKSNRSAFTGSIGFSLRLAKVENPGVDDGVAFERTNGYTSIQDEGQSDTGDQVLEDSIVTHLVSDPVAANRPWHYLAFDTQGYNISRFEHITEFNTYMQAELM